jgi:hypothetical protein
LQQAPAGPGPTAARKVGAGGPLRFVERASLWLSLAVTAWAFHAAYTRLGPDSSLLPLFNSDSAVPGLMANAPRWGIFEAYFWGQDRFGAWPFFLAHALSVPLHRPVTPEFVHALATLFILAGALPAALLARPYFGLALLAYAVAILAPEAQGALFEVAQPYPWYLPLLLWAWWCIRRSWSARGGWPLLRSLVLAALVSCLASWTSSLSGPLLLGLTGLEGLKAQATAHQPWRRWCVQFLPCLLAIAAEAMLRGAYHRYGRATYQRAFRTGLTLDWGHLKSNAKMVWLGLERPTVLAALFVLTACISLWVLEAKRARFRWSPLRCTVVGAFLLALLPLPVLVCVRHVRLNFFAARYFAPTYVFLLFGSLLAVASFWPERRSGWTGRGALLFATVGLSLLALVVIPRAGTNPSYARLQRTARALAERAPGAPLLDGYWGTYVFAGLAPPGGLVPLPRTGDLNRTPANAAALATTPLVVVGHQDLLSGPEGSEPPRLFQYGTPLQLVEPRFFSDGVDAFSSYRPLQVEDVAFRAEPSLENLELEAAGVEVTVRAGEPPGASVLAVELTCLKLAQPPSGFWQDAHGRGALEVEQVPGAVFFSSPAGVGPLTLHLVFGREQCQVHRARWFKRPSEAR